MKFLLDENFPKAAAEVLTRYGYEVLDFRDIGEHGAADSILVELAREIGAVIVTTASALACSSGLSERLSATWCTLQLARMG